MQCLLGYLAKLKRSMGLTFGAHFLHNFSTKRFCILYSINGQSFNVIPQDIKQNVLLSSYLDK